MKKTILACFIAFSSIVNAETCIRGAVIEIDSNGHSKIISCDEWDRPVEAVLAEQKAKASLGKGCVEKYWNWKTLSYMERAVECTDKP